MRNLFIVQTPFQLVSAIEGAHFFDKDFNVLLVLLTTAINNRQMEILLKQFPSWQKVISVRENRLLRNIAPLCALKRISKWETKPHRIFIGEYRSWVMNQFFFTLSPEECFLLDDGAATIEIQQKYLPDTLPCFPWEKRDPESSLRFQFLRLLFSLKPRTKQAIHLFTCFDLKPYSPKQMVIRHSFERLQCGCRVRPIDQSTVFFFGSIFSEIGWFSIDRELFFLSRVLNHYKNIGKNVVYVPHRREAKEKLRYLQEELGVKVHSFDLPAEVGLTLLPVLPAGIASYYSTILTTLPSIFDFESVTAFKIPVSEIPQEDRSSVETVYSQLKNEIQIIEIE